MFFSLPSAAGKLKEQTLVLAFRAIHVGPQKDQEIKANERSEGKTSSKPFF